MRSKPRDGGRNAQLRRALGIVQQLDRSPGASLEQLAQHFGTTERTIRRDLIALQEAGVPLLGEEAAGDRRKLWKLDARVHSRDLRSLLDDGHFLALRVAMGQGGPARSYASVFSALEDLHQKIEKALGTRGRERLRQIDRAFYSYEKQAYREAPPDVLWSLVTAIVERRVCRVTYRKPQPRARDKTYEIQPLRVFAHQGAAYLMCRVPEHDAYATLNLQRIRKLVLLERQAEVPSDFAPERFENAAFGVHTGGELTRFALRFDAEVAPYIRERVWHANQNLVELRGGGIELTFTCGASWEVSAWVASWRHWVTVLEPAWLRAELRELGRVLVRRYASGTGRGKSRQ